MRIKFFVAVITAFFSATGLYAHDFQSEYKSQVIYYKILPSASHCVEVTSNGNLPGIANSYTGDVEIPEMVVYNGEKYDVVTIGKDAFSDCRGLTSVTIPRSVKMIEEYNFLKCPSLSNIKVMGQGTCLCDVALLEKTPFYQSMLDRLQRQKQTYGSETFDETCPFGNSYHVTFVRRGNLWGVADRCGNVVIPCMYEDKGEIESTYDKKYEYQAYAFVVRMKGKWGVVDLNNNVLVDFTFPFASAAATKYAKMENSVKSKIAKATYQPAMLSINGSTLYYASQIKNHLGVMSVEPQQQDKLWGIMRTDNGEWIQQPQYDYCLKLAGTDRFLVSKDSKAGLIDADGKKVIIDCAYEMTSMRNDMYLFAQNHEFLVVWKNGKYIVRAKDMKPMMFTDIKYIAHIGDVDCYTVQTDGKWMVMLSNEKILPMNFDDATVDSSGNTILHQGNYTLEISPEGDILRSVAQEQFEEACNIPQSRLNEKISKYKEAIGNDYLSQGYIAKSVNNIGVALQNAGNSKDALAYYQKAMELDSNEPLYQNNYNALKNNIRQAKLNALAGMMGAIASLSAIVGNSGSGSSQYYGGSSGGSSSSLGARSSRVCSLCHGTGHIDDEVPTYGYGGTKWCPECHAEVPASHCHGCKVCPSCHGKGYL